MQLYSPLVWRWCRRYGLQAADAEDVGQDVFKSVAAGLRSFEHDQDRGSFRGWLRSVTRTRVIDFLRARQQSPAGRGGSDAYQLLQQATQQAAQQDEAGEDEISQDTQLLYQRALELIRGQFSELHWKAFQRTAVDGQPAAEVAQELGISRHVVYNARSRIMRRLREEFAELLDTPPAGSG